jgi:hypothetical protein
VRAAWAVLAAIGAGWFTYSSLRAAGPALMANDFTYCWIAARAVLVGHDPYAAVLTAQTPWGGGWFYPYPAALVALPFAWMPVQAAGAAFVAISFGILAYVLTRGGSWRMTLLVSATAMRVCQGVQWSALLLSGALSPVLLGLAAAKPNLAAALFAYQDRRQSLVRGVAGALLLTGVSLLFAPAWPVHWLATLKADATVVQYQAPILTPLGMPIALALLRWRRPEARLLLAMSCLPQNGFFYDQLPLILVPGSLAQAAVFVATSHIGNLLAAATRQAGGDVAVWSAGYFPFMVASLYLPCLYFVLRRPNEGVVPAWLEKWTCTFPRWLRGTVPVAN